MYYSAKGQNSHDNECCIGVSYSTTPIGPFIPTSKPWYCPPSSGAIDVDGIIDDAKSPPERYVLFENASFNGAEKGKKLSRVALWQVSADDGSKTIGDPVALTQSVPNGVGEESHALTRMPDNRWLLLHTKKVSNGADIRGPYHNYHLDSVLLHTGNETENGSEIFRAGGSDFVDGDSADFIFAAMDRQDSSARHVYAAAMEYSKGKM